MYKVCPISVFLTEGYEQAIYYIKYVYLISMQRLIQIASVKAIIDPGKPVIVSKEAEVSVTDTISGLEWTDILELCPISPLTGKGCKKRKNRRAK